ncbi:MAG: hypothetical protein HQL80_08600 [Magnetococcales bacterium]|nr:hypothetical protein [Magnetococcales bacterium]
MEMVATLTLFAIVVAVSMPMLSLFLESYSMAQGMAPASSEGALAMERMVRELRWAKRETMQLANRSLTFATTQGESVRFHQTQPGDATLYLVKQGVEKPLAYAVAADSLSFALLAPGLVEISFRLRLPWIQRTTLQPLWTTAAYIAP